MKTLLTTLLIMQTAILLLLGSIALRPHIEIIRGDDTEKLRKDAAEWKEASETWERAFKMMQTTAQGWESLALGKSEEIPPSSF